jgi:hypothetical protein
VVVDGAERQAGALGDLAHGSAGISLFKEKGVGGIQKVLAGAFALGGEGWGQVVHNKKRTFVIILASLSKKSIGGTKRALPCWSPRIISQDRDTLCLFYIGEKWENSLKMKNDLKSSSSAIHVSFRMQLVAMEYIEGKPVLSVSLRPTQKRI